MENKDILMTGWVASEGVAHLMRINRKRLEERFAPHMLEGLERVLESEAGEDLSNPVIYGADIYLPGREGFYDSLWNIGERFETGLSVSVERIPLLQMAVEICDYLEEDIFELSMEGRAFIICRDGAQRESELRKRGVMVTLIGSFTDDQGRVMTNGERVTYLTPPKRRAKWR